MALTLEQVAKLAGVSRSTVSRVVNEHPASGRSARACLESDSRQELSAASGGAHARHPAHQRNWPDYPGSGHPLVHRSVFSSLTQGIAEVCNQRGYYLMLTLMTATTDRDALYRRILHSGQLDGIIAAAAPANDPILPRLQASHRPCVLVGHDPDYPSYPG